MSRHRRARSRLPEIIALIVLFLLAAGYIWWVEL